MSFACGQAAEGARECLPCEPGGIFNRHSFQHRSEHRTAGQSGRAAISQKPRGFDAIIPHMQRETQAVTANGIRFFRDRRSLRQLASVTWIRQMVFEGGGV